MAKRLARICTRRGWGKTVSTKTSWKIKVATILNYFKGRELIQAFRRQALVQCDAIAAKKLADVARCLKFKPKKSVVKQGDQSDDVFFVLQGSVEVRVNGTRVATRRAGCRRSIQTDPPGVETN
jgi:hypothetical protein